MRLRQLQSIVVANLEGLLEQSSAVSLSSTQMGVVVHNFDVIRRSVEAMKEVPALVTTAATILQLPVFREYGADVRMTTEVHAQFSRLVETLFDHATLLEGTLRTLLPREHPFTVAVEVTAAKDFGELADIASDLHFVISNVGSLLDEKYDVHPTIEESDAPLQPEIRAFDLGSQWVEIVLPTLGCVTLVGAIATAATTIVSQLCRAAIDYQRYKAFGVVVRDMEDQAAFSRTVRVAMARQLAQGIADGKLSKADNESVNKLAALIDRSTDAVHKGVRLLPASTAPVAAKAVFPASYDAVRQLLEAVPQAQQLTVGSTVVEASIEDPPKTKV